MDPHFWDTVYIFEDNGSRNVKSNVGIYIEQELRPFAEISF